MSRPESIPIPRDRVVGVKPWLLWPFCWSRWWSEPIRAERVAALRIGLGLCMLFDLCTTYLPDYQLWFGEGSMGAPDLFAWMFKPGKYYWSILRGVESQFVIGLAMMVWAFASFTLLIGFFSRTSAIVCWVLTLSFASLNSYIDNAGDQIRGIVLFYLMLAPCGAAWSVDSWWWRRHYRSFLGSALTGWPLRGARTKLPPDTAPLFVYPWTMCLMFIQMCFIYFMNGAYKHDGSNWRDGNSLYYVMNDLTLARWAHARFHLPYPITQVMTWCVLYWELAFPILIWFPWRGVGEWLERLTIPGLRHLYVLFKWNAAILLLFGFSFHVGIAVGMEIGGFPWYMMCMYLPLIPWERWSRFQLAPAEPPPPPAEPPPAAEEPPQEAETLVWTGEVPPRKREDPAEVK
jgi:hypothetical protein